MRKISEAANEHRGARSALRSQPCTRLAAPHPDAPIFSGARPIETRLQPRFLPFAAAPTGLGAFRLGSTSNSGAPTPSTAMRIWRPRSGPHEPRCRRSDQSLAMGILRSSPASSMNIAVQAARSALLAGAPQTPWPGAERRRRRS
ncbi:hypothetical protein BC834DRAFT_881262 [Gloeopeniophorella convolvens]|nr:hypothetical protein BC834DRAFT_881262 [Gloeopeniophorella convolvens]